jgi:hypothetical protein
MPDADTSLDDSAGKIGTPDDPNAPSDSPIKAEDTTGEQLGQQEDEYKKQLADLRKKTADEHERYRAQMQPFIDHFEKSAQDPVNPPQQSAMQMPQEGKDKASQAVMNVLAIAAIAFTVFGRKSGNPYAQGAVMSGLGALFQGYAQGKHQKAEDDKIKWHELWQAKNQENKDRVQQYRETLADKRLDASQQMDLIRMKAQLHHDSVLESAAEKNDLNAVVKNLEQKRKAHQNVISRLVGVNAKDYRSGPSAEWRALVLEKSKGEIDPARNDDEREKAYELYPYAQFLKDRKQKTDKAQPATQKKSDPLDLGI